MFLTNSGSPPFTGITNVFELPELSSILYERVLKITFSASLVSPTAETRSKAHSFSGVITCAVAEK